MLISNATSSAVNSKFLFQKYDRRENPSLNYNDGESANCLKSMTIYATFFNIRILPTAGQQPSRARDPVSVVLT